MFELTLLIVAILLLYGLAKKYILVQNEKVEIWVEDQRVDLQDDLKALSDRVDSIKEVNGKWFSLDEITSKMN